MRYFEVIRWYRRKATQTRTTTWAFTLLGTYATFTALLTLTIQPHPYTLAALGAGIVLLVFSRHGFTVALSYDADAAAWGRARDEWINSWH